MELKEKVIIELERKDFPNLEFLYSEEVLNIAEDILLEFLDEDIVKFNNKLKIDNKDITFDLFEEESNLSFFWGLLNHLTNINSWDKVRSIIENIEPKLNDFYNDISYSKRYFEMFEYCFNNCELNLEQKKIIEDSIRAFKIKWINLEKDKQDELKIIIKKLSELSNKYSNNLLDSEKEFEYTLEDDLFLKELPKSDLTNALDKAKIKWKKWYLFDSSHSSYISILKYCNNSEIRKYFLESHNSFASEWKYDNREIVLHIIKLREKKAKILNYKNYAELSLEFKMAKNPEEVIDLLNDLAIKSKPKALKEVEEIKDFFWLEEINQWDMAYYSRLLKEKKYNLDDKKLKDFFEFENTKKALFETVEKLYWIEMKKIDIKEKYNNDIEIYEVYKWEKFISYFMWDYFYNENKRSWAWANELRERFEDKKSIVINNMSFIKSENILLTLSEVETIFHEFWHAIHSMLSKSKYADLTWVQVEWDFVELPSQLLENWSNNTDTIINVAKHYQTWKKIPNDLVESLEKLKYFWTGNFVLWQSIIAITDMMFHSSFEVNNIEELNKKFLNIVNELAIFKKDDKYKMYCSFWHIFDGWYSAWYYSYLWADIIVDEVLVEFKKYWMYDKQIAWKFEKNILWAGSVKKAAEMFEDFMWRGIQIDAFMERKGL